MIETVSDDRIEGAWYWVTDGVSVWPAVSCKTSAGGWTNQDTWEDFHGEVCAWLRMDQPTHDEVMKRFLRGKE